MLVSECAFLLLPLLPTSTITFPALPTTCRRQHEVWLLADPQVGNSLRPVVTRLSSLRQPQQNGSVALCLRTIIMALMGVCGGASWSFLCQKGALVVRGVLAVDGSLAMSCLHIWPSSISLF